MDGIRRGVVPRASRPHFTIETRPPENTIRSRTTRAVTSRSRCVNLISHSCRRTCTLPPPHPCPPHYETYMSHHWYRSYRVLVHSVYRVPIFRFWPNCTLVDGERFEKVSRTLLRGHPLLWCVRECVVPIEWVHSKISALLTVSISVHIRQNASTDRHAVWNEGKICAKTDLQTCLELWWYIVYFTNSINWWVFLTRWASYNSSPFSLYCYRCDVTDYRVGLCNIM